MPNTMEELQSTPGRISRQQAEALERFPELWGEMMAGFNGPGLEDRAWLMYSANYLFHTAGVRWAMDPVRLCHRLPEVREVDVAGGLRGLSFVVLTHQHSDHLDLELIASLAELPITWVVPEFLVALLQKQAGISQKRILVPRAMEPFEVDGIRLTAFDGLHWERIPTGDLREGGSRWRGVPSAGYLAEFSGKRWLFPGDTRTYDAAQLPAFGVVDGLFAHVWLGRGAAQSAQPPLLNEFCDFCLGLQARRIVLAHLHEYGREAEDYWHSEHAGLITSQLREREAPTVTTALMGDEVRL